MKNSISSNNTQSSPSCDRHGVSRRGQTGAATATGPRVLTGGHLFQCDAELPLSTPSLDGCVDWISFTVKPGGFGATLSELVDDIAEYFPAAVGALERGRMGYTSGLELPGHGCILWNDDRLDMGVHVVLPSKALRCIDKLPQEVCEWVLLMGGNFTRVDVAIDSDQVRMSQVIQAARSKDLVSRSPNKIVIENLKDGSETLYVGSRKGRRFVRFYDKALEQQSKTDQAYDGIWTRCEVEFKREYAQIVAEHIVNGADLRDAIFSCVDFREASQNENITRCDRLPWWEAWIGAAQRLTFAMGSRVVDEIAQAYRWLSKQVAPTLAFIDQALGPDAIRRLIDFGSTRIPNHREQLLVIMESG